MATKEQQEEYEWLLQEKEKRIQQVQEWSRKLRIAHKQIGRGWEEEEEGLAKAQKELDRIHSKILQLEKEMGR